MQMEQTKAAPAFSDLAPSVILDAVEALGLTVDGRLLELNSFENRVYQVGIEDDDPIIAKFYRNGRWSDAQIREEHTFTLACHALDLPVVPPLIIGDDTLHEHAGYRLSLSPRRGGQAPPMDDPEAHVLIGRFLGRLHNVGAAQRFQYRPAITLASFGYEPRAQVLDSGILPDHLATAYQTLTDDLLAMVATRLESIPAATIRIHGDFHPGNVLWRDDCVHVVDFDDARTGPAIQDLWMFLPGERTEQEQALHPLLAGYTVFRDFDPAELALIEPLRSLRLVHYGGWLARRHNEPAFCRAFPWFTEARWWEDHVLTLREQLAALQEPSLDWRPY